MPMFVWLLLGGVTVYLITKSGAAAAASAAAQTSSLPTGTTNLSVQGPVSAPGPYSVPVEAALPAALQQQFVSFFANADQPSFDQSSVGVFSLQLAGQGYTIAAGSVQSVWQMIVTELNSATASSSVSTSACPPGTHSPTLMERISMMTKPGECVPDSSSSSDGSQTAMPPVLKTTEGFTYQQQPNLFPIKNGP